MKDAAILARDISIDFLRGIAIVLVVLGHCIQYGSGNTFYESETYFQNWLFRFIYSFHMPMFALISGYLFFWSMRRSGLELLKKQIFSLIVPILVWKGLEALAYGAVHILRGTFTIGEFLSDYFSSLPDDFCFWFLWAMFWCSMIVLFVEKALRGKWWIYPVLLAVMCFLPPAHNIYMYVYVFPYFTGGFLFHKQYKGEGKSCSSKRYAVLCCVLIIAFVILFIFYDSSSFIYTSKISLLRADNAFVQFGIDLYRWLIGFIGSGMVILMGKMVYKHFSKSVIVKGCATLGQISLGIYILNSYTSRYVLLRVIGDSAPNIIIWILEMVISLAIYYATILVIQRIPVANKLLLGGRTPYTTTLRPIAKQ